MEIARDREEGIQKLKIGLKQLSNDDPVFTSHDSIPHSELAKIQEELN